MSKKRRKQKQGKAKADITDDIAASAEAEHSLDEQPESLPVTDSGNDAALEAVSEPVVSASENVEGTEAFGDAGTEYIEGFLREELGLDGDLTDDEFAMAALDFLGDESDGGTVFFKPEELSEMAAQERISIAEALEFDDDAFAKSVEELEEAIAAVSDPEFQKEGTVMVTLPDSVGKDAEAILTVDNNEDEEASVADVVDPIAEASNLDEAELATVMEAVAETPIEVTSDDVSAEAILDVVSADSSDSQQADLPSSEDALAEPEAIAETTLDVETELADAPVAEVSFSQEDLALDTLVAEPSTEVSSARAEAEASMTPISEAEQAELDEAMLELLEIQAMLDDDGKDDANEPELIVDSTESAESTPPSVTDLVEAADDDVEAVIEDPVPDSSLFDDEDLTEEEQALLLEMIAEEEAAKATVAKATVAETTVADEAADTVVADEEVIVAEAEPIAVESSKEDEPTTDSVELTDAVAEVSGDTVSISDEQDETATDSDAPIDIVTEVSDDDINALQDELDKLTTDELASTDEIVMDEEAAILAMMAELEGMDLDSIDLDSLDLNELSAEDALNELASLIDESSEDSAIEAAFAQLDAATESLTADGLATIEPEQFEETSDYLDTLVAALDDAVSDIGLDDSAALELVAGDNRLAGDKEQLIVFTIGDSDYAVPIDNVIEVGEPITATAVPFVPRWVRGVINLRGEIISLVDLREYFEASNSGAAEWMIVAQNRDASMVVGFIVDDVRGNRQFSETELADLTSELEDPSTKYLQRIYRQEEGLVVALDFEKLLNSADMRQFEPI